MLSPRRLDPARPAAAADSAPRPGQMMGQETGGRPPSTMQPGPLPSDPGVQVDSLGAVQPDTVGTLGVAEGGFGLDMWRGTSRALVDKLLPSLPTDSSSAAIRSLARRLLLSAARPPVGEGESGSLLRMRAGLLAEMGDLDSLEALLNIIPSHVRTPELTRIEANMRFLANDNARACALAAGQIGQDDAPFWEKAFVFCQALAGERDKAALGVSLLRETGVEDDVFYRLMDALTGGGGKAAVDSLSDPTPLLLAMARAANVQLPADVIAGNRPMILRAVATSPNAPVELRLEAGERAESMGALPAKTLRELYTAIDFSKEELDNPLSRAEAESGPLSRALLYRTSIVQTVPVAQVEAVDKALSLGREGGRYVSTARVFLPILNNIPPSAELLWFAPEAIRALLAIGETDQAASWYGVLRASALFNPESEAAVTALRPVLHLAGDGEEDWRAEYLSDWWNAAKEGTDGRAHAALMFCLFDAFGEDVADGLWDDLLDGSQRVTVAAPQPAVWFKLRAASADGRIGETVLLGLLALGDTEPDQVAPVDLYTVLQRLRAVGLEAEARQLAVEAALAAGA